MTDLTYRARGLGPLQHVDWAIPSGVSVVVGPNRVGKSTLLRLPELTIRGGELAAFPSETLRKDGVTILHREFSLGDLFAHLEFGGDDPVDPE